MNFQLISSCFSPQIPTTKPQINSPKQKTFNSPHSLHLMNVASFRAFLINLMTGMRRSTDCKSMREYLNDLDCAIDAHLRFHLRVDCMENVQVREAKAAVKSVARDCSLMRLVSRIVLVGGLA
jgi:hypothetical protein